MKKGRSSNGKSTSRNPEEKYCWGNHRFQLPLNLNLVPSDPALLLEILRVQASYNDSIYETRTRDTRYIRYHPPAIGRVSQSRIMALVLCAVCAAVLAEVIPAIAAIASQLTEVCPVHICRSSHILGF